ncbi:hypothetical protein B0H13DRAFT_1871610 [Mycena leptocephala]|nr:hypothetical protein B0H13DRAFT_1871610 [Mycena leptocephala]
MDGNVIPHDGCDSVVSCNIASDCRSLGREDGSSTAHAPTEIPPQPHQLKGMFLLRNNSNTTPALFGSAAMRGSGQDAYSGRPPNPHAQRVPYGAFPQGWVAPVPDALEPINPLSHLRVELKAFSSRTSALPDILSTSLLALKESADAFPPLKSAVGGVLAVWDIAQRAEHSKSDACENALRTEKILNVIADAVPDGLAISPLLHSVGCFTVNSEFTTYLSTTEAIAFSRGLDRFVHLGRNEHVPQTIQTQLDDAYRDLLADSVLRGEVQQMQSAYQQAQFVPQQTQVQIDLKKLAAGNVCDHLSFVRKRRR